MGGVSARDPGDEVADVVDGDDRVVGRATRREIRAENLLHRAVAAMVRRSTGDVFVHRRAESKDVFPGMYDMFVAGMVGAGESYEAAVARELEEELGIERAPAELALRHRYEGPLERAWSEVFAVRWDGPIRIDPVELAWGGWLTTDELDGRLSEW